MQNTPLSPRVAITGMALCNALGCHVDAVWEKTLAMHSGVRRLTPLPDDPPGFFDPPYVPGVNSYCDVAALCDIQLTRHDLGLPPHDFTAMSASSRLTLYLARATVATAQLATAGYDPQRVGVFVSQNAGESASTLWDLNVSLRAEWIALAAAQHGNWDQQTQYAFSETLRRGRRAPDESTLLCRLNCTVAGMICRQFGFAGPSFSVGAACASSTAAIFLALRLLHDGTIDAAVVGGGEEIYAPLYMAEFCALGALARSSKHAQHPHEYSRPFDAHRNGFVLGEGAAMLVLEREDTARKRGASIHGLITGAGHITNTLGIIEPNAEAQQQAMRLSFKGLDYGPKQVQLIECHATGTLQGDLEEGNALAGIFGGTGAILTAYKGQIGHTTGASGATSLIHGLLAMRDGLYPGTVNCPHPDPAIPLADAGLRLLAEPEPWSIPTGPGTDGIRRMQVNSFAFGGACFALQVEEPNDRMPRRLQSTGANIADMPAFNGQESVVDGVRLVSLTHLEQSWRLGTTTPTWIQEIAGLPNEPTEENLAGLTRRGLWLRPAETPPPVAFLCCGQGAVWPGMGRALYDAFAPARAAMDRIAAVASWDVLALMNETDMEKIVRTRWQQPYLFLLEFAQASYLYSLGFAPKLIAGHSLGELIALCLAGAYTPETAWHMIETRAQQMDKLEEEATRDTGMMAVYGNQDVVEGTLKTFPDLLVSNYNTPNQYILSGPRDMLTEARRTLRKNKVPAILLNVSMAFHHPHMRVMREASLKALHRIPLEVTGKPMQPLRLPMISCVTAQLYPQDNDGICRAIADLDESAVNWVGCVRTLWETGARHFVELGPMDTLCGLTNDIVPQSVCVPAARKDKEVEGMRAAVAHLYALGHIPHPVASRAPHPAFIPKQTLSTPALSPQTPQSSSLLEEVFALIMEATGYERHELAPDMDLRHDLAIRSSRFPMIIQAAERRFGISIRFEDLIGVATIRDLGDALTRLCKKAAPKPNICPAQYATGTHPLRRLLPCSEALTLPRLLSLSPSGAALQPLVLVGHNETARHFTAHAAYHVATLAEALSLLGSGIQTPRALVLALSPQETEPTEPTHTLTECLLLLQAFTRHKEAQLCLVTTLQTDDTPKPLYEGLVGMLSSASFEYPTCTFRTIIAHPDALPHWADHALHTPTRTDRGAETFPVQWHIHANGTASTPALVPAVYDPAQTRHALGLRSGDVIVISGGAGGIAPHALEWLAPLGCVFALLGRRNSLDTHSLDNIDRLESLGATARYYPCDITNVSAVKTVLAQVHAAYGRIDGILHAAGVTHDATLSSLTHEHIHDVIATKCRGLDTLLHSAVEYGLRYAVAFSSLAGWCGNYGQSNYSAANRAMAAQLHAFCTKHGVQSRCLWLPPILGAGMADSEDIRAQLHQRGLENACMDVAELAPLLAHELCACAGTDILWARHVPVTPTVRPIQDMSTKIVRERPALYPLVYPTTLDYGAQITLTGGHDISHYADACLATAPHKDGIALAPSQLLLGCLAESAAQALPWLMPVGIEKARLSDTLVCPHGVTREMRLYTTTKEWIATSRFALLAMTRTNAHVIASERSGRGNLSSLCASPVQMLACPTTAQVRGSAANGRRTHTWTESATGTILLSAVPPNLSPLWHDSDATPAIAHGARRHIFTHEELVAKYNTRYAWPVRWLQVILSVLAPDTNTLLPLLTSVEWLCCTGLPLHAGHVIVEIRTTQNAGQNTGQDPASPGFDAQVIHEDGTVLAVLVDARATLCTAHNM